MRCRMFGVALAVLLAVVLVPALLVADHDGGGEEWRRETLASCRPTWDPHDPRIHTWSGRTLHEEPFEARDIFYRVWGDDDLEGGRHLRRWRWEWECLHPRPETTPTPTPMPERVSLNERAECSFTPSYVRGHDHTGGRWMGGREAATVAEFRAYLESIGYHQWCWHDHSNGVRHRHVPDHNWGG